MKQSAFNEFISQRWNILKANTFFTFQKETAYWADNWASVLSTTFYTFSMLIFIHVLYANVKTIAGYTHNDMLLFFLVGQFTYYLNWSISAQNMQDFIIDVNKGDLDLLLTKPIPALFYITFKRIRLFSGLLRDATPPTIAVALSINWSLFHFSFTDIVIALIIFFCGQICMHVLQFIAVIPAIWLGESLSILKLSYDIDHYAGRFIPFDAYTSFFKFIFGTVFPVSIAAGFTSSILLGKSDSYFLLMWAILVTIGAMIVRGQVWKLAIKNYTSASS